MTCAGGPIYAINAYILCRLLRHLGCTLPVAWCYLGPGEMSPAMIRAAESVAGVRCHDLTDGKGTRGNFTKSRGGWQSKTRALLASEAEECLWLDADCFPERDPSFLFDSAEFQAHGAVFWPDAFSWEAKHVHLAGLFEIEPAVLQGPQFESGVLMVDKRRCRAALALADHYNQRSGIYYRHIFGDKDTFFFAWNKTGTPYHLIQTPVGCAPGMFIQHAPDGSVLFHHAIQAKFTPSGRSRAHPKFFPHLKLCQQFAKDFQQKQKEAA